MEDDKIIFTGKGVYDCQREYALEKGLIIGNIYTIDSISTTGNSKGVFLKEFPMLEFDFKMFKLDKLKGVK